MPRYLLTANFNVEADTEEDAENIFEDYLADSTILTDSKSVAFECVEAVMANDEDESSEYESVSQADGYADEGPEAMLREEYEPLR